MRNFEVGDIVVYNNGQKFRIVKNSGNIYYLVGVDDWLVYFTLESISSHKDFIHHPDLHVTEVIPAYKVQTVRVL